MRKVPEAVHFHTRLIVDLGRDPDDNVAWLVVRSQEGFNRLQDTYSDYATVPVSERVYLEWLAAIEGVFGHQILLLGRAQQSLGDVTSP